MTLETERFRLNLYNPETDLLEHQAMYQSAAVREPLGWKEPPGLDLLTQLYVDRAKRWEVHTPGSGAFAFRWKDNGRLAGIILLKALPFGDDTFSEHIEIGWHLAEPDWGKGAATEAASRVLQYGFQQLRLPAILAIATPDNTPSLRVMARLGLGFIEETDRYYGEQGLLYGLRREEFTSTATDPE
ncbi:GNAT family N-acetyltransferase [Saccharospirillum impatiens]|uniref:GNAT family N-acetyltransferase n=1 Tax=Saccharospirillum impatiens TaxID=169438 RepID=UPI000408213D|nr:GNAT family protein [Saccharospirillum impatiens]